MTKKKDIKYLYNTINKLNLVDIHRILQKFVFNGGFKHKWDKKEKKPLYTKPQNKSQKSYQTLISQRPYSLKMQNKKLTHKKSSLPSPLQIYKPIN